MFRELRIFDLGLLVYILSFLENTQRTTFTRIILYKIVAEKVRDIDQSLDRLIDMEIFKEIFIHGMDGDRMGILIVNGDSPYVENL